MDVQLLSFKKFRFFANKTHNSKWFVLAELSTCDVDVEGKLKVKVQNSNSNKTSMISPLRSMILQHEQQQKQGEHDDKCW